GNGLTHPGKGKGRGRLLNGRVQRRWIQTDGNGDAAAMYLHRPEEYKQKIKEYIQKYATEEALKEQEEGTGDSSSKSSMSDFSEDEAQDMEL
uniref:Uncharacterized protein n=1 Tax=Anas zonorhyncha TaxID=75864 RepID=A0A8B9TYC2_9AVES